MAKPGPVPQAIRTLHADIVEHCKAIEDLFKTKRFVTIVVRDPDDDPDQGVVVTNDDEEKVITLIRSLSAKAAYTVGGAA